MAIRLRAYSFRHSNRKNTLIQELLNSASDLERHEYIAEKLPVQRSDIMFENVETSHLRTIRIIYHQPFPTHAFVNLFREPGEEEPVLSEFDDYSLGRFSRAAHY